MRSGPAGSSSLLLPGRPHVQQNQGAFAAAAGSSAAVTGTGSATQGGEQPGRATQLEAMLALHMEHSRPCKEAAAEADEFGMAEDDLLEVIPDSQDMQSPVQ